MSLKKMMQGVLAAQSGGGFAATLELSEQFAGAALNFDSTGCTLLVLFTTGASDPSIVSDSEANTWQDIAPLGSGNPYGHVYYCINPSTSATHSVNISATFPGSLLLGFSGSFSALSQSQSFLDSGSPFTIQAGAVSGTGLVVSAYTSNNATNSISINQAFVIAEHLPFQSGVNYPSTMAYKILNSESANPTWTNTDNTVSQTIAFNLLFN